MKVHKRSNQLEAKPASVQTRDDATSAIEATTTAAPAADSLHHEIAVAAYFRAERRGFAPGGELEDWLCAEAERGSCRE
jgi:hypothetical protein